MFSSERARTNTVGKGLIAEVGYPEPASPAVTAVMKANRRVGTKPEASLRSALHRRGRRFRKDLRVTVDGQSCRPDIVFSRQRVAVFVDGCFWHRCPDHGRRPRHNQDYWSRKLDGNVARDQRNSDLLASAGWQVVRIWEHVPLEEAVALVEAALEQDEAAPGGGA